MRKDTHPTLTIHCNLEKLSLNLFDLKNTTSLYVARRLLTRSLYRIYCPRCIIKKEARMNTNANNQTNQQINAAIESVKKRNTKKIDVTPPAPTSIWAYLANAAVGMALSYIERVDAILKPVLFCLSHVGTIVAAMLHLFIPLLGAWFASHWSARMEETVWTGSLINQLICFASLWLISLAFWSFAWLLYKAMLAKLGLAISSMANNGESYLKEKSTSRAPQHQTEA